MECQLNKAYIMKIVILHSGNNDFLAKIKGDSWKIGPNIGLKGGAVWTFYSLD